MTSSLQGVTYTSQDLLLGLLHIRVQNLGLTHYSLAMPYGNIKIYFRGSFQFIIVTILKKYHRSGNLKCNNASIFQSLQLRISWKKYFNFSYAKFHSNYFGLLWVNRAGLTSHHSLPYAWISSSSLISFPTQYFSESLMKLHYRINCCVCAKWMLLGQFVFVQSSQISR